MKVVVMTYVTLLMLFVSAAGANLIPGRSVNAMVVSVRTTPKDSLRGASSELVRICGHVGSVRRVRVSSAITNCNLVSNTNSSFNLVAIGLGS